MLIVWFLSIKSLPNLLFCVLCLPGDQSHQVCATDNKPSCVLHLLGWFIGSRGFSSLERRPEFWVLHMEMSRTKNNKNNLEKKRVGGFILSYSLKEVTKSVWYQCQEREKISICCVSNKPVSKKYQRTLTGSH